MNFAYKTLFSEWRECTEKEARDYAIKTWRNIQTMTDQERLNYVLTKKVKGITLTLAEVRGWEKPAIIEKTIDVKDSPLQYQFHFKKAANIKQKQSNLPDKEIRKKLNQLAREQLKLGLLKDICFDMQVCKIEKWDYLEYLKELRILIDNFILERV